MNSVLFLNNLQLQTTSGCRIYTTGTVFVQGAITYLGSSANSNLQICSSRAILLGLGKAPGGATFTVNTFDGTTGTNTVQYRLQDFWPRTDYFTRGSVANPQVELDQIVSDSNLINAYDLLDASQQTPNGRNQAFQHLLLRAAQTA